MKINIENHLISNAFNRIASIIFLRGHEGEGEVVHALADYVKHLPRERSISCNGIYEHLNLIENFSRLKIYMNSAKFNFHIAPIEFNLDKKLTPNIYEIYSLIFDKIPINKGSTLDFFVKIIQSKDYEDDLELEINIYSSEPFQINTEEILNQTKIRDINSKIFRDQSMIIDLDMKNSNEISIKFHLYEVTHASN
jgi:hypothetical protein